MDNRFSIAFAGLKEGKHQFKYEIDNTFFESNSYDEILGAQVEVHLDFVKKSTMLELDFSAKGDLKVACDLTNELYNETIATSLNLIVKFGDFYDDENEEVLIIPYAEHQLNVTQFIYEMLVLAVPIKKEHPGIADGTLKSDILEKLEELQPKEYNNSQDTDPRWSKLKDLLDN